MKLYRDRKAARQRAQMRDDETKTEAGFEEPKPTKKATAKKSTRKAAKKS